MTVLQIIHSITGKFQAVKNCGTGHHCSATENTDESTTVMDEKNKEFVVFITHLKGKDFNSYFVHLPKRFGGKFWI